MKLWRKFMKLIETRWFIFIEFASKFMIETFKKYNRMKEKRMSRGKICCLLNLHPPSISWKQNVGKCFVEKTFKVFKLFVSVNMKSFSSIVFVCVTKICLRMKSLSFKKIFVNHPIKYAHILYWTKRKTFLRKLVLRI